MKNICERCGRTLQNEEARACTHECTFCHECAAEMNDCCPNCGGTLVTRVGTA